jgi:tRNA-dihydrouridine synthase 1
VLHNYLNLPVTVKIRILPNLDDTIKMAKMLQACGARLITVHGRTKEQLKDRTGPNDFAVIARLKKELDVPVLSNGGIENYDDVQTALKVTGADGIMTSGRNYKLLPSIFLRNQSPHSSSVLQYRGYIG